jgi:hypothetical protein
LGGCVDSIGPFLVHLEKNGLKPLDHFHFNNTEEQAEFYVRGIAINRKGQCFEFSSDGGWAETVDVNSIGSGERIAQHYLLKGCDALTAVLETCTTELSCGGVILSYDWKTNKFTEITP